MEAVILIGIPGSGKTTFCRQRLLDTHIRLSMDMLRTRRREAILLRACLDAKQPFVIDNTNPTVDDRQPYIRAAKAHRFRVVGHYFPPDVDAALRRNAAREAKRIVPPAGFFGMLKRLQPPAPEEGFDVLHHVQVDEESGRFTLSPWDAPLPPGSSAPGVRRRQQRGID